jgi:hypothetical protein
MTASLAQSDFRLLRELANSWQDDPPACPADELHGTLNEIGARRAAGGDLLDASVYGATVPALRDAARLQAEHLWGLGAELVVENVGVIDTSGSARGAFRAVVRVRLVKSAEVPS